MKDNLELGDLEIDIFKMMHLDRAFLVKMIINLKPEYFESTLLQKLFKIYKGYFDRYSNTPTRKITDDLLIKSNVDKTTADAYLDRIFVNATLDPKERDYLVDEVVTFAKQARMKEAVMESIGLLEKNDFAGINEKVRNALLFNLDVNVGYDLYDVDERYRSLKLSLDNRVPTGYAQLDRVLVGGWAKKELYAVMGPPGIGKSVFLPNFGLKALLNGLNVIHYTLEMSEDRLGMRYDACASNIAMNMLMSSPDEIKQKYETIKKVTQAHLKMKEYPTSLASILDFEANIEQFRLMSFVPDMLIVDYGDIMRSTRKTNNLYEEQGWIFRELRGLAVKTNTIIITATQSNRDSMAADGGTKEIIGMNQTADSMEKNRILDALFSITQTPQEKDAGRINLWVAKNRNGESGIYCEFLINYSNMQIKEVSMGQTAPQSTSAKGGKDDAETEDSLL
jgi:replicative DNA helicase